MLVNVLLDKNIISIDIAKIINGETLEEKKFVLPYEIIERESVIEKK